MYNPNECGMTTCLHLSGAGTLNILVHEIPDQGIPRPTRCVVNIGAGVRIQEVALFLDAGQLVQLAGALEAWARSIQAKDLPESMVGAVDPQQDDELVDVRGDK